ncbi:hypothetical protein B0T10DRAFT_463464 [Thelonectria olida]|uniref:Uncharacterized protein n=1 Tax=Thelonectria olida TaxID=1576542 RepID=A0A9P8VWK5_9HYPO|nr:hypothetical protein B0T10DRAFT_463464 [Thelonectria olida]
MDTLVPKLHTSPAEISAKEEPVPLAEMQAQLWILNILAPEKIPRTLKAIDEDHYRLTSSPDSRIRYGVDHESYAYQLALDMDSAPGLWSILALVSGKSISKSLRLLIVWGFGAHFNTKFRLQGPWRWNGAVDRRRTTGSPTHPFGGRGTRALRLFHRGSLQF